MADPQRISITICGDGGCGKSSITLRLVRSAWTSDYDPTIEDSYSVTRTVDGIPALLSLTDTAGQEEYRGLISSSSLSSDAFLLVYDITNPDSLHAQLPYFLELVQQERDARAEGVVRPNAGGGGKGESEWTTVEPVVIVAGNKCDLKEERKVSAREGLDWARSRECGFMETSARECVNVEETFALIVRRVREAREAHRLERQGGGPAAKNAPMSPKQRGSAGGTGHAGPGGEAADAMMNPSSGMNEKGGGVVEGHPPPIDVPKERWWNRLKCW